jgi:DNA ligase (NAD+)
MLHRVLSRCIMASFWIGWSVTSHRVTIGLVPKWSIRRYVRRPYAAPTVGSFARRGHRAEYLTFSRGVISYSSSSKRFVINVDQVVVADVKGLVEDESPPATKPKRQRKRKKESLAVTTDTLNGLDEDQIYQQLQWLSSEIRRHDGLYYESGGPEISDAEYDALVAQEAMLCQTYPHLLQKLEVASGLGTEATRYGGRIGIGANETTASKKKNKAKKPKSPAPDRHDKQQHLAPMLSLDNALDTAQLLAWLERIRKKLNGADSVTVVSEPKLDGVSLSLRYEQQQQGAFVLAHATTRGDGRTGRNVTAAALALTASIPRQFQAQGLPAVVEIRGEVILPLTVFCNYQQRQQAKLESFRAQQQLEQEEEALRLAEEQASGNGTAANKKNATKTKMIPFELFSNARNAASGILMRKEQLEDDASTENATITDPLDDLSSQLLFFAYDIVSDHGLHVDGVEVRNLLAQWGFQIPQPSCVTALQVNVDSEWQEDDIPDMLNYHDSLRRHREGSSTDLPWGDYEMDGCVHKVSQCDVRLLLGASTRFPRWAVAHKFPALQAVTRLLAIDVQVGRTGALTPVAKLEPVDLAGVTVQRATLHNFFQIQQLFGNHDRLARGCSVLVRRAGDVIPQVVKMVGKAQLADAHDDDGVWLGAPTHCPACGSPTEFEKNHTTASTGKVLRCSGPSLLCPPQAVAALKHAFSRDALDITGLSEKKIEQLMEAELLQRPSDVFSLARDAERLAGLVEMDGWGPTSVEKLARVVNKVAADGISLDRFIYSLGLRHVGSNGSRLLAAVFGTGSNFLSALDLAASTLTAESESETIEILRKESDQTKGIGPVVLASLESYAKSKELMEAAHSLASLVRIKDDDNYSRGVGNDDADQRDRPLQGLSVVFTGGLPNMTRKEAQTIAKELGAKSTPNSVSKSTGLVVAGDDNGAKVDAARKSGIRIISSEEFQQMIVEYRGAGTGLDP